jgi:hypothetical protein
VALAGYEKCVREVSGENLNIQLERPRRKWEANIKTELEEITRLSLDWRRLAHVGDKWLSVVNTVTNFFHKMGRIFSVIWGNVSFSLQLLSQPASRLVGWLVGWLRFLHICDLKDNLLVAKVQCSEFKCIFSATRNC